MTSVHSVENFKDLFEFTAKENSWKNVYFRAYRRNFREKKIYKVGLKKIKLYLAYIFTYGDGYYAYLTHYGQYTKMDAEDIEEVDKRGTKLTPDRADNLRKRKYMNDRIYTIYKLRTS